MRRKLLLLVFSAGVLCAQALPSYTELKFPALGQIQPPEVATHRLPNGMRLYLLEDHELPLAGGFALIRTGNLFDPPDKAGLAQVTGAVLRTGGTRSKTGDELDIQLENMAASVESSIGESSGQVTFSALRENTDEVLAVFKEVLRSPEFRQEKIDLVKMQLSSAISRRNDEAQEIAGREFAETVYGKDTPYGWRIEYATLDRIQRQDLLEFYRRYFFPGNILLAVYGDFSAAEMKAKLEKLFGDWDSKQPPPPAFPPVRKAPRPGVYLATKSDVNQTVFQIGHLGGVLRDSNYPALESMADILGGGFSSRLFKRIRTQLGYAYGIGASWGAGYNQPGLFQISGSTKSESTAETIRVVREEIDRIRSAEVSEQELKTAKDTVLNGFIFNFDSPGKTLSRLVRYEYHGYPKDFIFQYQQAIAGVTRADVLRVAKEYIKPQDFTIVAVGNPKDFKTPLSALGLRVQPIDLTIPEPKAPKVEADKGSLEKGRGLLARVQQAVGGAGKLAAVKDFSTLAEVQIQSPGGAMKARQTNRWVAPSHFRQDVELPFGKLSTYFDGASGWISGPQGTEAMSGAVLKQAELETFRVFFGLLLSDRDPARRVKAVEENVIEISDQQGHAVRLWIEEKTGLPVKQTYQSPGGPPSEVEEVYDEWMEVDGIRAPRRIRINRGGARFGETRVQELKLNSGLKAEELSKRP